MRDEHPDLPSSNVLGPEAPTAWAGQLGQTLLGSMPSINEVVFLHPQNKTLIVADMAFNLDRRVDFVTGCVLHIPDATTALGCRACKG